jgi:hypothetical protein
MSGVVPIGAIKCSKCAGYEGAAVRYKKASVVWAFGGLDKQEEVIYQPIVTKGDWTRTEPPLSAICVKCKFSIPVWQLNHNKYIRTYNVPQPTEENKK